MNNDNTETYVWGQETDSRHQERISMDTGNDWEGVEVKKSVGKPFTSRPLPKVKNPLQKPATNEAYVASETKKTGGKTLPQRFSTSGNFGQPQRFKVQRKLVKKASLKVPKMVEDVKRSSEYLIFHGFPNLQLSGTERSKYAEAVEEMAKNIAIQMEVTLIEGSGKKCLEDKGCFALIFQITKTLLHMPYGCKRPEIEFPFAIGNRKIIPYLNLTFLEKKDGEAVVNGEMITFAMARGFEGSMEESNLRACHLQCYLRQEIDEKGLVVAAHLLQGFGSKEATPDKDRTVNAWMHINTGIILLPKGLTGEQINMMSDKLGLEAYKFAVGNYWKCLPGAIDTGAFKFEVYKDSYELYAARYGQKELYLRDYNICIENIHDKISNIEIRDALLKDGTVKEEDITAIHGSSIAIPYKISVSKRVHVALKIKTWNLSAGETLCKLGNNVHIMEGTLTQGQVTLMEQRQKILQSEKFPSPWIKYMGESVSGEAHNLNQGVQRQGRFTSEKESANNGKQIYSYASATRNNMKGQDQDKIELNSTEKHQTAMKVEQKLATEPSDSWEEQCTKQTFYNLAGVNNETTQQESKLLKQMETGQTQLKKEFKAVETNILQKLVSLQSEMKELKEILAAMNHDHRPNNIVLPKPLDKKVQPIKSKGSRETGDTKPQHRTTTAMVIDIDNHKIADVIRAPNETDEESVQDKIATARKIRHLEIFLGDKPVSIRSKITEKRDQTYFINMGDDVSDISQISVAIPVSSEHHSTPSENAISQEQIQQIVEACKEKDETFDICYREQIKMRPLAEVTAEIRECISNGDKCWNPVQNLPTNSVEEDETIQLEDMAEPSHHYSHTNGLVNQRDIEDYMGEPEKNPYQLRVEPSRYKARDPESNTWSLAIGVGVINRGSRIIPANTRLLTFDGGEWISYTEGNKRITEGRGEYLMEGIGRSGYYDMYQARLRGDLASAVNSPTHLRKEDQKIVARSNCKLTFSPKTGYFGLTTTQNIHPGKELFYRYGPRFKFNIKGKIIDQTDLIKNEITADTSERWNKMVKTIQDDPLVLRLVDEDRVDNLPLLAELQQLDQHSTIDDVRDILKRLAKFSLKRRTMPHRVNIENLGSGYCGWATLYQAHLIQSGCTDNEQLCSGVGTTGGKKLWLHQLGQYLEAQISQHTETTNDSFGWANIKEETMKVITHIKAGNLSLPLQHYATGDIISAMEPSVKKSIWRETIENGCKWETLYETSLKQDYEFLSFEELIQAENCINIVNTNHGSPGAHFLIAVSQPRSHQLSALLRKLSQQVLTSFQENQSHLSTN